MSDLDLAWRIEKACLAACPSPREIVLGDRWLVRIAGGTTRRTNAVNPLRAELCDPTHVIPGVERLYRNHGQPTIFRVPSIARGMEAPLARRGFVASGDVSTLLAHLGDEGRGDPDVELTAAPSGAWLDAKFHITPKVGATPDVYRTMVAALLVPARFAAIASDGRWVSLAYGAIHENTLVLESVATDPGHRRHGLGRRVVGSLMAWARGEGADLACLQVESANAPAHALYRSLGFRTELYRYHYRSRP